MIIAIIVLKILIWQSVPVESSICALGTSKDFNDWIADDAGRLSFPVFNSELYNVNPALDIKDVCDTTLKDSIEANITTNSCQYNETTQKSVCRGLIGMDYIQSIKNQTILSFVVTDYSSFLNETDELVYHNKTSRIFGNNNNPVLVVPNEDYKLAGQIFSSDIGLGIKLSTQFKQNYFDGFSISGDAYSNELRLGWKVEGKLFIFLENGLTTLKLQSSATDLSWSLNLTATLLNVTNTTWTWNVTGCVDGDSVFGYIPFSAIIVSNEKTGWEAKGLGLIESNIINWTVEGSVSPTKTNRITIPSGFFAGMNVLHMYFSDSNFMGDFDKNAFQGLNGLKTITFTNSKIEELPSIGDLLYNMSSLKALYFEKSSIPNLLFGNTSNLFDLELVSLKGSGPIELDKNSFLWLQESPLTYLNLQDCNIKTPPSNTGGILTPIYKSLRYLDLSYASITDEKSIQQMLQGLKLTHISLAGLELSKVPKDALTEISDTLQYLTLRGNNLQKIPSENLFFSTLDFPQMDTLFELDLTNCGINFIEHGTFDHFPNLRKLYLAENSIENIQDGWVKSVIGINYIDLSNNGQILSLEKKTYNTLDLQKADSFESLNQIEILDLSNGLFDSPETVLNSIRSTVIGLSVCNINLHSVTVNLNLSKLQVLDISDNPIIQFSNLTTIKFLSVMTDLQYLHMRGNKITNAFFTMINTFVSETNNEYFLGVLRYLDLRNNNIKTLTETTFENFPALESLDLSQNSLTVWPSSFTIFMTKLKILKISDNKLEGITKAVLDDIQHLERVQLGKNPFTCNCDVMKFNKMMQFFKTGYLCAIKNNASKGTVRLTNQNKTLSENARLLKKSQQLFIDDPTRSCVSNFNKKDPIAGCVYVEDWINQGDYYCYEENSDNIILLQNYNVTMSSACENKEIEEKASKGLYIIYVIMSVLLSLAILLGLIYWKWWDIRLLTRAVRNATVLTLMNRDDPELYKPFEYSAFVSYSDKDRSWVIHELLPKLETWDTSKICLHERDFQVGLSILENISNCMDKSQNIILVMSQSFLKSQWCQFEMHFAQHRLLETRRDHLIIVLLETIPKYKRPKTLKYLLRTKTYLQWPEKSDNFSEKHNFWTRLHKALSLDPSNVV